MSAAASTRRGWLAVLPGRAGKDHGNDGGPGEGERPGDDAAGLEAGEERGGGSVHELRARALIVDDCHALGGDERTPDRLTCAGVHLGRQCRDGQGGVERPM